MKISEMTLEQLRNSPFFHLVDPSRLETIEDFTAWLEAILHNPCNVYEQDGEEFLIEIRQLVAKVNGLKIEVYANEHPPPHFHVKSPNVNASFSIESCELLEGRAESKDIKKIRFWHKQAKPVLINTWNLTRPTNCTVGAYVGT
jgi:Domain of unknown function (DUF4160)